MWSESDGLPGVIVDRYGDHFVLQTLTLGMDMRRDFITAAMVDLFGDIAVIERNDAPVRKAEGLELRSGVLQGTPSQIAIEIGGVTLDVIFCAGTRPVSTSIKSTITESSRNTRATGVSWTASQTREHLR